MMTRKRDRDKDCLPHVTDIIARAGLVDTSWYSEHARNLGRAVHAAIEYLDEDDLDWDSVDSLVVSRVLQYEIFKDELKPTILSIEEEVVNVALQYCGRLDRRIMLNGIEGLLDVKGPMQAPWQGIQLAMYAACFDRPLQRWTLHLSDDKYRLVLHRDRNDWAVAKAAITIAAWKERNNVKD